MAGINKAIIVGNLGADPELRDTQNSKVCRLSVATSRRWTNQQTNEQQEETEWHRVTVWGKQAENCAKYLKKGRQVYVEGRLRTSSYEKDDAPGHKFYSTEIVAEVVQFLSGGQQGGDGGGDAPQSIQGGQGSQGSSSTAQSDPDDDIPF